MQITKFHMPDEVVMSRPDAGDIVFSVSEFTSEFGLTVEQFNQKNKGTGYSVKFVNGNEAEIHTYGED